MRINLRGGAWKNSEDEVLKAAVMKYGLNNWARVASLLSRKTARQCKARWYEWIDPAVRKTEWTLEEEERLLHLAKVFPSQWRTIAPMVGRTAHQCLTHYEKLLDIAQGRSGDLGEDDPRKLRPGDIDPAPETKPSRADAVDMDEDELEMLAEARARLANTRGKKAKRKAREKQMEAAKRLSQLQKKRELKAAGIGVTHSHGSKNKGDMWDHSVDIAFEKQPKDVMFSTQEEKPQFTQTHKNVSLAKVEGIRRDQERKKLEDQDRRRLKKLKEDNLPEALKIIEEMNAPAKKRYTPLLLPAPELNEEDVMEIVKIGQKGSQFSNALNLSVEIGSHAGVMDPSEALQSEKREFASSLLASINEDHSSTVEDQGLKAENEHTERSKRHREWEMLQSEPVKRKLPRPVFLDKAKFTPILAKLQSEPLSVAEEHIMSELKSLVSHDCINHPMSRGMIQKPDPNVFQPLVEDLTRDQLDEAKRSIMVATSRVIQYAEKNAIAVTSDITADDLLNKITSINKSNLGEELLVQKLTAVVKQQEADIKRLNKMRSKYMKSTNGYKDMFNTINTERVQLTADIANKARNLEAIRQIALQEEQGYNTRMNEGRKAVSEARIHLNSLQDIAMEMDR